MNMPRPHHADGKYSKRGHPVIKFERFRFDFAFEIIALIGIIYTLFEFISAYAALPDQLPSHYGLSGQPDASGPKALLFVLIGLMLAIYAAFTLMPRAPWNFNYPWKITLENAPRQYRLVTSMLTVLKSLTVWLLAWVVVGTVNIGLGQATALPSFGLYLFLVLTALTIIAYFMLALRAR